jgi:hypothetical protein
LTETISNEKIVLSTEKSPLSNQKIAERKTIAYETRTDTTVIKVAAERDKVQLFARFGFLKPKREEIHLKSIDKYYEPYMVITGKYFIDYYRKCAYTIKIDERVLEVILLDHKLEPDRQQNRAAKDRNLITLHGEERLKNEIKASLILDKSGQEVPPKELPSAPSEKHPKKVLAALGTKEIAPEADLEIIKSKILKRPKDINRLVNELFEVTERAVIYVPRFRVLYKNARTGEEKTMEFDGVTAERIQRTRQYAQFLQKLT